MEIYIVTNLEDDNGNPVLAQKVSADSPDSARLRACAVRGGGVHGKADRGADIRNPGVSGD